MEKITDAIIEMTDGSLLDLVIIDHSNEQFTSMPKAVYEAQQVEHLTEKPTSGE